MVTNWTNASMAICTLQCRFFGKHLQKLAWEVMAQSTSVDSIVLFRWHKVCRKPGTLGTEYQVPSIVG